MGQALTEAKTYSDLIESAYLSCIRSVLIIDDEYPTLDGMLERDLISQTGKDPAEPYSYKASPKDVMNLVKEFRNQSPPLLVDIHDGKNIDLTTSVDSPELAVAQHLHQSDFVILDYSLDSAHPEDPSKAIAILRKLARNSHFNLVMMHSNTDPNVVFQSVVLGMLDDNFPADPNDDAIEAATEYLNEEFPENYDELSNLLTEDHSAYLAVRAEPKTLRTIGANTDFPFASFHTRCEELGISPRHRRYIAQEILEKHHERVRPLLCQSPEAPLVHYSKISDAAKPRWLKSETVFVGFSGKDYGKKILSEMLEALSSWHPQPPRLLMRKLVVQLDEKGALAENEALGTKHASAIWYRELLNAEKSGQSAQITELVNRHSETLLSFLDADLVSFVESMIQMDAGASVDELIRDKHFGVDLTKETDLRRAVSEHNQLVSTIPISGNEITTGHIFKLKNDYWICLSATCDLVPEQVSEGIRSVYGPKCMPMLAVQLSETSENVAAKYATEKRFIYVNENGSTKYFCISSEVGKPDSYWDWHNFILTNDGAFDDEKNITFARLGHYPQNKKLKIEKFKAKVVGQLRYPYALALASELGSRMTRIGLGYLSI